MDILADKILLISIMALPFLLAVTLHEAGHAYMANALGDMTPKASGRLSLNPLVHLDPIGTVLIPLVAILGGIPFLIGYAKPVMIQPRYFKNIRRDMVMVALAGPGGNLIVALFCALVLRVGVSFGVDPNGWLFQSMFMGVYLNCLFMVFNLLPIPPLDGGGVVEQFLPYEAAKSYRAVAPYGFFILLGIIIVAKEVVLVPTVFMTRLILALAGVNF